MRPNTSIWILRLLFCQCKPVKVKKKSVLDENLGLVSQIHGRSLCVKPTPHFWILKRSYKLLRCAESFIFPVKIKCPLSKYSLVWLCYTFSWSSPLSLLFSHLMHVIWTILTSCALNFNYIQLNPSFWVHISFEAIKLSREFCRHVDCKFRSNHVFIIRLCSQSTVLH